MSNSTRELHINPKRGFTLIELLVVIAIIGLLASIVLASLNAAKGKGRDAARISDVQALKTALELYYNDNNTYPQYLNAGAGYSLTNLQSYLVPTYIGSIPSLLISDNDGYVWGPTTGQPGTQYGIHIYVENSASWCKTGVNIQAGWWGVSVPACPF